MDYRSHLSSSLLWKWHLQDFRMVGFSKVGEFSYVGNFAPRYAIGLALFSRFYKSGRYPLTTVATVRLAFQTSIVAAGFLLERDRKDGEVIARSIDVRCRRPISYVAGDIISVSVDIEMKQATSNYHPFVSKFAVGKDREHYGETLLLYCQPHLKNFSYL